MKILRILNLDGGGMKGLLSANFMQAFCEKAKIQGDELWKHFDFIGGTSIGSIMGGAYASGSSPSDLINFFKTYGPQIFCGTLPLTQGPIDIVSKLLVMGSVNVPAGEGSFYGTASSSNPLDWYKRDLPNQILKTQLQQTIGADTQMFQLKTNVLFTAVEKQVITNSDEQLNYRYRPVLFSNMLAQGLEGQNYFVSDVVQASASAPFYFPHYPIVDGANNTRYYIDGGIGINNPSAFLLAYSGLFDSDYDKIVMLSVGCGIGDVGFFDPNSSSIGISPIIGDAKINLEYMQQMISVAGGSAQEASAQQMQLLSDFHTRINGADFIHYRFNTTYPEKILNKDGQWVDVDTELDSSSADFIQLMDTQYKTQMETDQQKIAAFIYNCDF